MLKRATSALILSALLLSSVGMLRGSAATLVEGSGSYFCSEFITMNQDYSEDTRYKVIEWLKGFYSGLNSFFIGQTGFMKDLEGAKIGLDVYLKIVELCRADPDSRVYFKALDV